MQAFRLRGIVPESASFFSEGAIAWPRRRPTLPPVEGLVFGDPNGLTRDAEGHQRQRCSRDYVDDPTHANCSGFDRRRSPVDVPSFHPVFRINPDGSLRTDMVVEAGASGASHFDERRTRLGTFPLRGGATIIISKPTCRRAAGNRDGEDDAAWSAS